MTTPLMAPPATNTCPFNSNVAVCPERAVVRLPVAVHIPVAGSYSSALAKTVNPSLPTPPATNTCPFNSNVAVWEKRAVPRSPVALHLPGACAGAD